MGPDDPPSPAESEFITLLQDPRAYSRWAAKVRREWEKTPEGRRAVEAVRSKQ